MWGISFGARSESQSSVNYLISVNTKKLFELILRNIYQIENILQNCKIKRNQRDLDSYFAILIKCYRELENCKDFEDKDIQIKKRLQEALEKFIQKATKLKDEKIDKRQMRPLIDLSNKISDEIDYILLGKVPKAA